MLGQLFSVVQQPRGNYNYLSLQNNLVLTQWQVPAEWNNVGFLAEQNLAGTSISQLKVGDDIELVYSDYNVEDYVVYQIDKQQLLQYYDNGDANWRSLQDGLIRNSDTMIRMEFSPNEITFQTCTYVLANDYWLKAMTTWMEFQSDNPVLVQGLLFVKARMNGAY